MVGAIRPMGTRIALGAGDRAFWREEVWRCYDKESLQQKRVNCSDAERGALGKRTLAKSFHGFMMKCGRLLGNGVRTTCLKDRIFFDDVPFSQQASR